MQKRWISEVLCIYTNTEVNHLTNDKLKKNIKRQFLGSQKCSRRDLWFWNTETVTSLESIYILYVVTNGVIILNAAWHSTPISNGHSIH